MSDTTDIAARRRQSRVLVVACLVAALFGCLLTYLMEGPAPARSAAPRSHLQARPADPGGDDVTGASPSRAAAAPPAQRPATSRARRTVPQQLITVSATSVRASTAWVQRWTLRNGTWVSASRPVRAEIGGAGLTPRPSEGRAATPLGIFTITDAFGAGDNAGDRVTRMDYHRVRYGDSWGSDPRKPTYNRLWNCHCAAGELWNLRTTYFRYGLVIDYNRSPVVRGAGSGFFVHVTDGRPTGGCVGMKAVHLAATLKWLDPAAHPRISIRIAPRDRVPTVAPAT